jgi:hypothetical protein
MPEDIDSSPAPECSIPCTVTLHRGAMYVCPCPEGLKAHLSYSVPFPSKGNILRKRVPHFVDLSDGTGIGCPRFYFPRVRQFLGEQNIPFRVEEHRTISPPPVTRRILRTISDRHYLAIQALMNNLDAGGGVILHRESEDISGLLRGLIRIFHEQRIVVWTKDKNEQRDIVRRVNRYIPNPEDHLRPPDYLSLDIPRQVVIHRGEMTYPEPDEVDVFIMIHADLLSGPNLLGDSFQYYRSLKFGFASKTRNAYQNKIPFMEEAIGPIVYDLRKEEG